MSSQVSEAVFSVGENPALKASNISGRVVITGAPVSEIRLQATKRNDGDAEKTIVHIRQHADGTVEIKVEPEQGALGWLLAPKLCSVDMDIQVPHNCRVSASVVSASLEMRGIQGDHQISSVSGEMALENLTGDLSITTVSGDVEAAALQGAAKLNTVSGDVAIARSSLRDLTLSTVSADIALETAIYPQGEYRFSTVSGSIDWEVPAGTNCQVRSSAVSGNVTVHTTEARQRFRAGKQRTLVIGEGGPEVKLSSVSGDLHIRTRLPAAQAA